MEFLSQHNLLGLVIGICNVPCHRRVSSDSYKMRVLFRHSLLVVFLVAWYCLHRVVVHGGDGFMVGIAGCNGFFVVLEHIGNIRAAETCAERMVSA